MFRINTLSSVIGNESFFNMFKNDALLNQTDKPSCLSIIFRREITAVASYLLTWTKKTL